MANQESNSIWLPDEEATLNLGKELASELHGGDILLLKGSLGAGKTTFARGLLAGLGWTGEVRSPSFTLIQLYDTDPPVMHSDLYRLVSPEGVGLEDYLETHLCLIEWPERIGDWIDTSSCWLLEFSIHEDGRICKISRPHEKRTP